MTDKEKAELDWFRLAMQYYVAARLSHSAGGWLVFGNLFHHAIEMALKGSLSRFYTAKELKMKYGHELVKLWEEFTKRVADTALEKFNQTIKELDKFEKIRYPDRFHEGVEVVSTLGGELVDRTEDTPGRYQLQVQEIDKLLVTIFEKSSVHSQKYTLWLPSEMRMYIEAANPVASKILRPSVCEQPLFSPRHAFSRAYI